VVARIPKRPRWPSGLAFSPDAKRLYSVTGSWETTDQPSRLTSWKLTPPEGDTAFGVEELNTVDAHTVTADDLAITADGRRVLTSGSDSRLQVWDADTLKQVAEIVAPAPLYRMHLFGDPPLVAAGDATGHVWVWDLATTDLVASYTGHEGAVYDVTATPDGRLLITAGEDKTLRFWPGPRQGPDEKLQRFVREAGQPEE